MWSALALAHGAPQKHDPCSPLALRLAIGPARLRRHRLGLSRPDVLKRSRVFVWENRVYSEGKQYKTPPNYHRVPSGQFSLVASDMACTPRVLALALLSTAAPSPPARASTWIKRNVQCTPRSLRASLTMRKISSDFGSESVADFRRARVTFSRKAAPEIGYSAGLLTWPTGTQAGHFRRGRCLGSHRRSESAPKMDATAASVLREGS